jgi:hypothetical protein
MNKKKTYLQPKRCQQHLLGHVLCLLYGAVSVACTFSSCPILIIPPIMYHHCCFGCVVVHLHLHPCHHLVVALWWFSLLSSSLLLVFIHCPIVVVAIVICPLVINVGIVLSH